MAAPLLTFSDFRALTPTLIFTGDRSFLNEAQRRNYELSRLLKGKDPARVLKRGSKITDMLMFDEQKTAQPYQPNQNLQAPNPQVVVSHEINWRFTIDGYGWTDQEEMLNGDAASLTFDARFQRYKDLMMTKEVRVWTSMLGQFEDYFARTPSATEMEAENGLYPHSIFSFISESPLYTPAAANGPGVSQLQGQLPNVGWGATTTVMGINPATQAKWRNALETYATRTLAGIQALTGQTKWDGFVAMDRLIRRTKLEAMPLHPSAGMPTRPIDHFTASLNGVTMFEAALRQANDHLRAPGGMDAAYTPHHAGIPIEYWQSQDTALAYLGNGGTTVTEDGTFATPGAGLYGAASGPRFLAWASDYLNPVWHADRYFTPLPARHPSAQPTSKQQWFDSWHGFFCRSRQRIGCVSPVVLGT